jgi:GNAT superfamily N-acetyltransferase
MTIPGSLSLMNPSPIIRLAVGTDAATIAGFNIAIARETENLILDPVRIQNGVDALLADPRHGVYYVAVIDDRTVGQLMLTYEWSDWRNGNFWWIQSVYVEPEFRGRGIFTCLFNHIAALAASDKGVCGLRLYVEQHNERAKRTYERLGMAKTHYELYETEFHH